MSELPESAASSSVESAATVGRRGWFKRAGVAVAGLAVGSRLTATTKPAATTAATTAAVQLPPRPSGPNRRRGIDCAMDEGPF